MTRRLLAISATVVLCLGTVGFVLLGQEARKDADRAPRTFRTREHRISDHLFGQLQPVRVTNCELKRFGEPNDGGYMLCGNLLTAVQAGYSYGISNYDGWGCDLSKQLTIPLHQYRLLRRAATRVPWWPDDLSRRVRRRDSPDDRRPSVRQPGTPDRGQRRRYPPSVVKMDVEGAEWDSFLATPDAVFARIDQMAVEFHDVGDQRFVLAVAKLKESFHVAHLHFNNFSCEDGLKPFPARAYEVLFVNKRLGVTDGSPAPPPPHPLDTPNNPKAADCQPPVRQRK